MGWFDRKIYSISNTLTHSRFHALTSFPQLPASERPRVPASSSSPAPLLPCFITPEWVKQDLAKVIFPVSASSCPEKILASPTEQKHLAV